jgi:hypothetical protein
MYNLSLFSSNISQNNTIFSLYGLMIDANLIEHPTIMFYVTIQFTIWQKPIYQTDSFV